MKDDEADEAPHSFEVVVPDQPPVVTPGLALALLRLFRRRMGQQPAPGENTCSLHPSGEEHRAE